MCCAKHVIQQIVREGASGSTTFSAFAFFANQLHVIQVLAATTKMRKQKATLEFKARRSAGILAQGQVYHTLGTKDLAEEQMKIAQKHDL
jgi:cytoplasmic iron level regulating protein YaaA (DUF328/UPF0246 family)